MINKKDESKYIVVYDPYSIEEEKTTTSVTIFKGNRLSVSKVIATYQSRPKENFYDKALKLLKYFNVKNPI
jgi:hypothetical protein